MSWGLEWTAGAWAAAAAAAALAAWAWHARRSPSGRALAVLRGLAAAALLAAVLRPAVVRRERAAAKPKLLILLDAGQAMKGKGGAAGTRLQEAVAWLKAHRVAIEAAAEPRVVLVSGRARALGSLDRLDAAAADDEPLRAEDAAAAAAALEPGAARAWLLSDGGGDGDPARAAAALGAPLDAVGVGPARREAGAAFLDLKAPDFAFLHGAMPVEATVEATGLAGRTVEVSLWRADEGAAGGWRELERRRRAVAGELETFAESFSPRADALGTARLRLQAESGGTVRRRELRVEVVRQKYRIMYLAGRPSAEYAYLREFLKADPNHELVSFVILRDPDDPAPAPERELSLIAFPADEIFGRSLPQFDLFVLENFSAAAFRLPPAYMDALKRFVAGGGALLVKGGENAFAAGGYKGSALDEILPVALSGASPDFVAGLFKPVPGPAEHPLVRLYDDAESSRRAWAALPSLDGWGRFASVRPGATVLASHPSARTDDGAPLPVAATRAYGRGKVMLMSTDSTWRWRLGAAADPDAAGFYGRFWTRAVQYLTGSLDLSKVKWAPLPDRLTPREPLRLTLRVFDESFGPAPAADARVSVAWTGPDGKSREVPARETEPGVWAVELTGLVPGAHRLRASARLRGRPWGEDEVRFDWAAPQERPMDRAWLGAAAEAGGGRFVEAARADARELLAALPPPVPRAETTRKSRPFAAPAWLALCAGLLLAEWALRRRAGHA